jgi:hypothetical protein
VDHAQLVDQDRQDGAALLRRLDEATFPVEAAFWWLDSESGKWSLILVTPLVETEGPREAYGQLTKLVLLGEPSLVDLERVTLVKPTHTLPQLLRVALRTGPTDIAGISFSRNTVNGVYIEDAFIYRL